ncbi:MarR family winged helix-turn-helix transcriptional regulator [Kineosporia babensis]|uniref:MarR family transcriptional regulator n=1 Tax=Kineosporia babensis TaxID=499548 RepID=A0A9X1NLM6_9ACTN|nr:MarR family transcriptional regulator [Kineosporia babensis]MCD5315814.1 MarR family transcriptional regulator [Kineosporia babensis]
MSRERPTEPQALAATPEATPEAAPQAWAEGLPERCGGPCDRAGQAARAHLATSPDPAPVMAVGAIQEAAAVLEAEALMRLSVLVQSTFGRVAAEHGLTAVQARMLCVLLPCPAGMAQLAGMLGVGKANLTGLVDRAAQRGLVERTLVPDDRRVIQVTLTRQGRDTATAFHQGVTHQLSGALEPLTPHARTCLRSSIATITDAVDAPRT